MSIQYRFAATTLAVFAATAGMTQSAMAQDEFNGATLDPKWTFVDSATVGSTYTLTGTQLQLSSPPETDFFVFVDNYGTIEANAPAGDNWEVVTKIDNWDPTVAGQQRQFSRCGIAIWQDNNHYITIGQLSDFEGDQVGIQSFSNFNPVAGNNAMFESVSDIGNTGPQASYLFRIQKADGVYRAAYSIDNGSTWRNSAEILRNTESPDGYFTNEKIRLFHAAGFKPVASNAVTPAKFDYVRVNTITPPAEVAYADDEFNGPSLSPQWQYFEGILEGFTFFGTGSRAGKFIMTAGPFADLWIAKGQATHIYQNAPASTSYTLTMKGGPNEFLAVGYELFNSYGIWLWHDSGSWALISNQRGESGNPLVPNNRIEYAVKHNRVFTAGNIIMGTTTADVCPEYLRITRQGANISLQYSFDNVNWTTVVHDPGGAAISSFAIGADDMQVRLFSKRAFDNGAPIEAEFDWLRAQIDQSAVGDWQLY